MTPQNGLTIILYGYLMVPLPVGGEQTELAVQFVYLDRQVNPQPVPPPFSFTLPPNSFWPQRPPPLCECCQDALLLPSTRAQRETPAKASTCLAGVKSSLLLHACYDDAMPGASSIRPENDE